MRSLSLGGVHYTYPGAPSRALDGVDLELDGGMVLLEGASGSGKSTLLRLCNGLIPHFHGGVIGGRATVLGRDVLRTPTRTLARDVGFVFQDPELQAVHATVERDVAFGLENLCIPRSDMLRRVDEALHRCGIAALRHRPVASLSGGERQRLALAGVLAMQPRLLVLDEPLSQLDDDGARALVASLELATRGGCTVLVAEHRRRLLLASARRRLLIGGGRVTEANTTGGLHSGGVERRAQPASMTSNRADGAPAVSLHRVSAGYGRVAVVHDVDLAAGPGDVVALTGSNGSGKTTLLRTIAGLLPTLAGRVERDGGRVAYLPQNPAALLHRPTVRAEIAWTLSRDGRRGDVAATLDDFGLRHVAERYPRDLSTGERQRAALAAVLAGRPSLALLDEPTRGMDDAARDGLVAAIRRVVAGGGSVVIATHDGELVARVATRVVELRDGCARDPVHAAAVTA